MTTTSIKVKSPRMLADMIAWTQGDFYPDPSLVSSPTLEQACLTTVSREPDGPGPELLDTVNFSLLDDDNIWSDV